MEDSTGTITNLTNIGEWATTTAGDSGYVRYDTTTIGDNHTWDSSGGWTTSQWPPPALEDATPEELSKIMKNLEVQVDINGILKKAKLSDLLKTGYLKLKQL